MANNNNNRPKKDVAGTMERLVSTLKDDEVASIRQRWSASPLRIGTVCSGTDAPIQALENLLSLLNANDATADGQELNIEHVFSCEYTKFKREFIVETSNPKLLFSDVTELSSGNGTCHDGAKRNVPSNIDVLIAGTECVDFSSLSSSRKALDDPDGKSGKTFWATQKLAKKDTPPIVILENGHLCPANEMKKAFEEIGYVAVHTKICSSHYLLPQSRKRAYFLFLHKDKARLLPSCTGDDWIETMERLGPKRQSAKTNDGINWTAFLTSDHATKKPRKKSGRSASLADSLGSKWLAEIVAIEMKEGLTPHDAEGGRPYSDATKDTLALQHLSDRAKMRLDVQCKRAMKAGIDPFSVPLLWNHAQQLRFTDAGFNASDGIPKRIAPCVTPKHEWIVSSRRGALTGGEALAFQGISVPKKVLSKFDCGQLRDLAGNAMSTTVVASVVIAMFLTSEMIDGVQTDKKRSSSNISSSGTRTRPKRTRKI